MFDRSIVGVGAESRRPWTFTVSLLTQALLLALAAMASVAFGPELGIQQWTTVLLEPPRPPAAAPPPREQPVVQAVQPETFQTELVQPKSIPDKVAVIVEERAPAVIDSGPIVPGATGDPNGVRGGVIDSIVSSVPAVAPPPSPPPAVEKKPEPATPKSVQVGGDVQAAKLIRKVPPTYPILAQQARIQGVVSLRAVIAEDGSIEQLELLSGHPLLTAEAIRAVSQWRYRPTLLNNRPVQVITQIEVRFNLH